MKGFCAVLLPKECNSLLTGREVTGAFLAIMLNVQAPSTAKSKPCELPGNIQDHVNRHLTEAIPMINMPLCGQMILSNPHHLRLAARKWPVVSFASYF